MTRDDLGVMISEEFDGVGKGTGKEIAKFMFDTITERVAKGEEVMIYGFAKITRVDRPARQGFNPRTHEPISIAATKGVKFSPSKPLKDAVKAG
jgi:DNA-binding protein HU-beta